jgi:two-component system NtrC family sensor kinase
VVTTLRSLFERHAFAILLLATLAIGALDRATDVDITIVQLAYLAPVTIGAWIAGRRAGVMLAVVAALCAAFSQLDEQSSWRTALNAIGCGGVFVLVAMLSARLRHYVEREQRGRHAAIQQLRHAERLNVIGVLASGVAHELGTPLNVIGGTAELLDALPDDRDGVVKGAATILRQTERISAIITHLLAFGRSGTGAMAIVDLGRVAAQATELLAPTARKRRAKIAVESAPSPVRVRAADSQVEQVISNLVLNAIQAMPSGGTVHVRTGIATRCDVDAVAHEFGSVTVEDEGTGIAERDLSRIFDPFFTTKGVGEGTGLGLSVSYGIVQDHGGSIEVASEQGRGTTFTVLLPLVN